MAPEVEVAQRLQGDGVNRQLYLDGKTSIESMVAVS